MKELTISTKPSWCIKQTAIFNKVQNFTSWLAINNKNIQSLPQNVLILEHVNTDEIRTITIKKTGVRF